MTNEGGGDPKQAQGPGMRLNIPEPIARGAYSNSLMVSHTREEFILDFINAFPPQPIVTARVITSPGHLKRLIRTLSENLGKYEEKHSAIPETPLQPSAPPAAAGSPGPGPDAGAVPDDREDGEEGGDAPAPQAAGVAGGHPGSAPARSARGGKPGVRVKYSEHISRGVYSNSVMVAHSREEFVLDFINVFHPQATVTARVITSPGHFKRLIQALRDNLQKYESRYGPILEMSAPPEIPGGSEYVMSGREVPRGARSGGSPGPGRGGVAFWSRRGGQDSTPRSGA